MRTQSIPGRRRLSKYPTPPCYSLAPSQRKRANNTLVVYPKDNIDANADCPLGAFRFGAKLQPRSIFAYFKPLSPLFNSPHRGEDAAPWRNTSPQGNCILTRKWHIMWCPPLIAPVPGAESSGKLDAIALHLPHRGGD